jgi:hypothetical protein
MIDGHAATVADRFEGLAHVTGEWVSGDDGVVPPHMRLPSCTSGLVRKFSFHEPRNTSSQRQVN